MVTSCVWGCHGCYGCYGCYRPPCAIFQISAERLKGTLTQFQNVNCKSFPMQRSYPGTLKITAFLLFRRSVSASKAKNARSPQEQVTNLPAALQQANPATGFKTSRFQEKGNTKQVNRKASAHGKLKNLKTLTAAPPMVHSTIPALCPWCSNWMCRTITGEQTPRHRLTLLEKPAAFGKVCTLHTRSINALVQPRSDMTQK